MQHAFLPIPHREHLTASTCITVTSHDGDTFSITPRRSPPPHLFFGMGIAIAIPAAAILLFNWPPHITIGSTAVRSLHLQVMLIAFLLAVWLLVVLVFFAAQRSAWAKGPFLTYSRTDGIIRLPRSSIHLDRRSVAAV